MTESISENGGVFWSVTYDGKPADTTKHTYCQAFAVYGLAAYYRLTGEAEALEKAMKLFRVIDEKGVVHDYGEPGWEDYNIIGQDLINERRELVDDYEWRNK